MGQAAPGSPRAAAAYQVHAAVYGGAGPGGGGAVPVPGASAGMAVPMLAAMGSGGVPSMPSMGSMPSMPSGGWVMVAPPAAAYLQSVQQWAGTAPGYMVYQHAQQQQQLVPAHMGRSGGALSPSHSGSLSPRGSGSSAGGAGGAGGRMASAGLPCFPSRMESALGGVPSSSRQASLDVAAAGAVEAAERDAAANNRGGGGRPRGGGASAGAEASPSARSGQELLHQLQAAAAAAEGGASAAAAAARQEARERRQEQGNDAQGSATAAAAEEAAAAAAGRGPAPVPPQQQPGGGSNGGGSGPVSGRSALSPARSGELNNSDYAPGGARMDGGGSNSSSQPELAGEPGLAGRGKGAGACWPLCRCCGHVCGRTAEENGHLPWLPARLAACLQSSTAPCCARRCAAQHAAPTAARPLCPLPAAAAAGASPAGGAPGAAADAGGINTVYVGNLPGAGWAELAFSCCFLCCCGGGAPARPAACLLPAQRAPLPAATPHNPRHRPWPTTHHVCRHGGRARAGPPTHDCSSPAPCVPLHSHSRRHC